MQIRPETPRDYASIAALHMRAFGYRANEALIVALHRQRTEFDAELSLVAEDSGRVVGHALFSPQTIRLLGENVRAVNLAPIAIEPDLQRQGIGGKLIEAGHTLAREKGYALSYLLGHPSYYPRFGYRTRAYGVASLCVPLPEAGGEPVSWRGPSDADLPVLQQLWEREEGAVDFATFPGSTLVDWISPNPAIESLVWARGAEILGYSRTHTSQPARPRIFLARDPAATLEVAAALVRRAHATTAKQHCVLPLHSFSASAADFGEPSADAWDAAMACPLSASPFDEYYAQVQAGRRPPGRPIWPVAFDL